jgi:aminopeptidase-like protein
MKIGKSKDGNLRKYYNISKNILFPINRSITGKGTLKTLSIIKKEFPKLKIISIKSGTKFFDWYAPPEWNVNDAYVLDDQKKKIIDFKKNNLHLVGYSRPYYKILKKKKLFKRLYFISNEPEAIPYITSYYKKDWGFCVSHNQFKKFDKTYSSNRTFKVVVDTQFKSKNGKLNYGELVLKGESSKEILISTYICHPSMANNELSGPTVTMALINYFKKKKLKKTLRFIFIPESIGSIIYICKNLKLLKKNLIGGYVLTCIGDEKQHSCMLSKYKNSPSDEALVEAYRKLKIKNYIIHSFLNRGSDERQFNSPGVDLKISSIFRSKYGTFKEYHSSLDNFDLVTLKGLQGGFRVAKTAIEIILNNIYPISNCYCEPHFKKYFGSSLSKNNYYSLKKKERPEKILRNFLQYADGTNSLNKISKFINLSLPKTTYVYKLLLKKKLIRT